MKVHLIISIILKLICYIFGETIQKGMNENLNPLTSEGDNLDLFSSTYQLQTLYQNINMYIRPHKKSNASKEIRDDIIHHH